MIVLDKIRDLIEGNKSVRMVAGDIHLTSELVLLVRMIFADGVLKPEELANFKNICEMAFGIPKDEVNEVISYLNDIGYETTSGDAARMFESLDEERKRSIIVHLISIARADKEIDQHEVDLIRKTANILGLSLEDVKALTSSI